MTAEEVALEEFREAVSGVRLWRRNERRFLARLQHVKEPDQIATLAVDIEAARCGKSEAVACVRSLARIIRAIRAERAPAMIDVDLLGLRALDATPEPVDVLAPASWQMLRFVDADRVQIDLGRGREIRIAINPRAGASEPRAEEDQ